MSALLIISPAASEGQPTRGMLFLLAGLAALGALAAKNHSSCLSEDWLRPRRFFPGRGIDMRRIVATGIGAVTRADVDLRLRCVPS
jgi:hypothetical protein